MNFRTRVLRRRRTLMGATIVLSLLPFNAAFAQTIPPASTDAATTPAPSDASAAPDSQPDTSDDIVVTARNRTERLMNVPVAVTAMSSAALARANASDLSKISELVPGVIVGKYNSNNGSSIGIRGISSPANAIGFEQSVSVALDGIQTSNGRIAQIGFFDLQQVEVLKGPQALFFGKNSPAGVISLTSAGPTDKLQITGSAGFEPVADEKIFELAVSGPITDQLGFRIALKSDSMVGWMYNDAHAIANPFYVPGVSPASIATTPGTPDPRVGNRQFLGRLTLVYQPTTNFTATFKLFGSDYRDNGPASSLQNIGPCTGANPRMYGIIDPFGECKADNHTTVGDVPVAVGMGTMFTDGTGGNSSRVKYFIPTLNLTGTFGSLTVTSLTGYSNFRSKEQYGLDETTWSQLYSGALDHITEFSQQLRAYSQFSGPLNFNVGLFYQRTARRFQSSFDLDDRAYYNAANGSFNASANDTRQHGSAYSVYGQLLYKIVPTLELAAGARYTIEKKDALQKVLYGFGAFATTNYIFPGETVPGQLSGKQTNRNLSPEVTLTWRPSSDLTVYAAYKTGFKSGGFINANPAVGTRDTDVRFGPERARGFEAGVKGMFLNNRLRLTADAFAYDFSDLQVNLYDAVRAAFLVNNAGKVVQRGAEIEGDFKALDILSFHAALTYVHNRFKDYTGACYSYAFPTGATRATATPPPNCSFANTTNLTLQQRYDGRTPARSPDWSGNAGFVLNVPSGDVRYGLTGDAFYTSDYYAADALSPGSFQKAFWRFNASASIATLDDHWKFSVIGRNLTNKYYLQYAVDRTGGASVPGTFGEQRGVVARGREVLIQAAFKF